MKINSIANCTLAFKCPRRWQDLAPTETEAVKRCHVCEQEVFLAEDEEAFGMLASMGRCVAVRDGSVESTENEEMSLSLGIPSRPTTVATSNWPRFLECAHEDLRGNAPGCLLNNNEPGSDGNYYSIDRNSDHRDRWDLFQCIPEFFFAPGFKVSPVVVGVTVNELYAAIESVGIFVQGHEAIALGLPFHGNND